MDASESYLTQYLLRKEGDNLQEYDVIIVGARCAGASLANFLAQKGYSICILDKKAFPSDTLSTHVFSGWDSFQKLGIADQIKNSSALEMERFRIGVDECVVEAPMVVTSSISGLRRIHLDQILLNKTKSFANVTVHENCRLIHLEYHHDRVCGVKVKEGGRERTIYSKVVVGADGRNSRVANLVGAKKYETAPSPRCIFYAYFQNVPPNPIPTFEFYWSNDNDIMLLNPTDSDLYCLAIMPDQDEFQKWAKSPEKLFWQKINQSPTLAARFSQSVIKGRVHGTQNLQSYLRTAYGGGWCLVGDAGGAVHPCAGAGIDQAVKSADVLSHHLDEYLSEGLPWEEAMENYKDFRDPYIRQHLNAAISLATLPKIEPSMSSWLRPISTLPTLTHHFITNISQFLINSLPEDKYQMIASLIDYEE